MHQAAHDITRIINARPGHSEAARRPLLIVYMFKIHIRANVGTGIVVFVLR